MLGKFGKFTLVERIAEGGMAEVFKATVRGPEGFERIVAIKRLHRALCEDADLTQMLVDEARIAVQLNHPNIGNVFDLGCIENQYFIIMEYIDGTDMLRVLEQLHRRQVLFPVAASLFVISEMLSGLHYAHTKLGRNGEPLGIVHRDVSPQNIMVTWDGRVKLVDFGIAKARNRAQTTQAGIIKGKFYYMAPEQAHGHHVDGRTDVFAAGMVLYEMLAGRSPYDDLPETELLKHVRKANFPPPSAFREDLDPELSALVEIATERNPEKRFSNAMEFQLALNDYRHRKIGAFAEPHLARIIAQIANASRSDENFEVMDRRAYRPSEESLLFERPDDEALAAAGGGAIPNRKNNPFSEDMPTEIYDRQKSHVRRDLPPSPMQQRPQQDSGFQTRGELPVHRAAHRSQQGMDFRPTPQRARPHTSPSIVHRVAKPKYIYLAIALLAVAVVALGVAVYVSRQRHEVATNDTSPNNPTNAAVAPTPPRPKKVSVAFNSKPPNAQVFINDVDHGTTPVSVNLEVGKTFRVEFEKDGFEVFRQNVLVSEKPSDVTATLEEAKGIVKILSFPPDAKIEVEGEDQGSTPLTLTGLETDQTYQIVARLGDHTMKKSVTWPDADHPVQEVMFEFQKVKQGAHLTLNSDDIPDKPEPHHTVHHSHHRSAPHRHRIHHRHPRHHRQHTTHHAESANSGEGLNVFGSSSHSSSSSDKPASNEGLNVFGNSGSSTKKAKPAPKKEAAARTSSGDEGLNVFGSGSSTKKSKPAPKKKPEPKKKKEEPKKKSDDLNIWGGSKSSKPAEKKKSDDGVNVW